MDDDTAVISAPSPTAEDVVSPSEENSTHQILPEALASENTTTTTTSTESTTVGAVATVQVDDEDDDEDDFDDYEYENDEDVAFSGFLDTSSLPIVRSSSALVAAPATIADDEDPVATESVTTATEETASSNKWRQPSQEAVSMSQRAERETSGGKRRLAQDLYRIMMADTSKAGFALQPESEDSMDRWTIHLFQFDADSHLAQDLMVLGMDSIELIMEFPEQYPFEPPFVQVLRPRFKRQTGFVMNGALCMELLTKDGWNPVNDIESVIVSIRSLLVVGDGRLEAATQLSEAVYQERLQSAQKSKETASDEPPAKRFKMTTTGAYTTNEAKAAYSHLSDYHKKKGWDTSGWWAKKG